MSVKEDLYSAKYTKATKVYFDELLTRLRNYQKQMSKISHKNANNYRAQINSIINKNNPTIEEAIEIGDERFQQMWSMHGIIDVLDFITAEFQSVVNKLYKRFSFSTARNFISGSQRSKSFIAIFPLYTIL